VRRVILAVVATVVGLVLLLTFKTHSVNGGGAPPAAIGTPTAGSGSGSSGGSGSGGGSGAGGESGSSGGSGGNGASGVAGASTVTGAAASTIYGPVQVQITVKGGQVTAAKAVEYPQGTSRDVQINAYAIPILDREAVSTSRADDGKIDMVSGATYTSQGYVTSLQSALDRARTGS
jgi:uncharacterized protein with FMN-binding domain